MQVKQVKPLEQVKLLVAQMAGEKQAEAMSAAQVHAYKRGLELSSAQKNKTKKQKRAKNREKHLLLSLQANRVLKAAEIFPLIFFFFSFFSFLSPTGVSQIQGSRS